MPEASLRATDEIQRSIEAYFSAHSWWYDRRKNYYRNLGKTAERIVSIPLLAQAVMAMGLSRPDNSRARPSSLLKRDDEYRRIFSDKVSLPTYLWLAKVQKEVDAFLLTPAAGTTAPERTNLRFQLSMLAVATLFGGKVYSPAQLTALADADAPAANADLPACLTELRARFDELATSTGDSPDKLAKGSALVDHILTMAFPAPPPAATPSSN